MSSEAPNLNRTSSPEELARPINIPPRPSLLMALQHEIGKKDPHVRKIALLLARDPAIAGNLLSRANSALFNLRRRIATVEDAITLIGLDHCGALVTDLLARRALARGPMMMPRFWDVSEKRARGMAYLCAAMKIAPPATAHHFGLFCDIGMPLMTASFPSYLETLRMVNRLESDGLIALENARHRINHAVVGAMLAEHWQIDGDIIAAIRRHHMPHALQDERLARQVRGLIAAHLLVDKAIQDYRGEASTEWRARGALAMGALALGDADVRDIGAELQRLFRQPAHG